jgi:hypothetical protein
MLQNSKNDKEYTLNNLLSDSIQKEFFINEKEHILIIANEIIKNEKNLEDFIKNNIYKEIFGYNFKINIKLKLNLREYLLISNILYSSINKYI